MKIRVIKQADNKLLQVEIPPDFQGHLEVDFAGKRYWKIADWVTLLTLIGILSNCLYRWYKRGEIREYGKNQ